MQVDRGNEACTKCNAGEFLNATGSITDVCEGCLANTYSLAGAGTCSACHDNSQSDANSTSESACECNAGYYNSSGPSCVACDPGSFKTAVENSACTECDAGDFLNAAGSMTNLCEGCLANSFSLAGAGTCTSCHDNAESDAGSVTESACTCAPGYDGTTATGNCTACLAGNGLGPTYPAFCIGF